MKAPVVPPWTLLSLVVVASAACTSQTRFDGQPTVASGRLGCEKKCAALKMELVGMVLMGEYSDGCICQVPGKTVAAGAAAVGAGQAAARVAVDTELATRPPKRSDQNRFAKGHDLTLDASTFEAKSRQSPTPPRKNAEP